MKKILPAMVILLLLVSASLAQVPSQVVTAQIECDAESVYVYQQFHLTISVSSTGLRLGKTIDLMSMPGDDVLLMGEFKELQPERSAPYGLIKETRRYRCSARVIKPGSVKFSPTLRVRVLKRKKLFIGSTWEESPMDLTLPPETLEVRPLPQAGRPDGFSGAVGKFSFAASAEPLDVAVGDIITVSMNISGNGYLENIRAPGVSGARDFKIYEPEEMPGNEAFLKSFEQAVIPLNEDVEHVPPVSFSYFDPWRGMYQTIEQGPFPLEFHEEKKPDGNAIYRPAGGNGRARPEGDGFETRDAISPVPTDTVNARIAPAFSALVLFEIGPGANLKVLEKYGDWLKVESGGNFGWIPAGKVNLPKSK